MIARGVRNLNAVLWIQHRLLTFAVGEEYVNTRVDKFIMDKYPRVEVDERCDIGSLLHDSARVAESESVSSQRHQRKVRTLSFSH